MKRIMALLAVLAVLSGCSAKKDFETISDVCIVPELPVASRVVLNLPKDAAASVMRGTFGTYYQCDGYELTVETLQSGDLNRTVQAISGYDRDDLTLIQTKTDDKNVYRLVWSSAGEGTDQITRATIIDDGRYHYVVTTSTQAPMADRCIEQWNQIHRSVSLKPDSAKD